MRVIQVKKNLIFLNNKWKFFFSRFGSRIKGLRREGWNNCPREWYQEDFLEVFVFTIFHGGLGSIWIRTGLTPCTGLSDSRQVLARPYSMPARFKLWWRDQTFYSTRPINGLFYVPHLQLVQCEIFVQLISEKKLYIRVSHCRNLSGGSNLIFWLPLNSFKKLNLQLFQSQYPLHPQPFKHP